MEYYVKQHGATNNLLTSDWKWKTSPTTTDFMETIKKLERLLHICEHRLHSGYLYPMPPEARRTFVKMMHVESYLNKLLQTDTIRDDLLKHLLMMTSSNISIA